MRRAPYPLLVLFLGACAQGGTGNGDVDAGVIGGGSDTGVVLMDGGGFVPMPDAATGHRSAA